MANDKQARSAEAVGAAFFVARTNEIMRLEADLKASEAERARLRDALVLIRTDCGQVCDTFEICTHVACASSYRAWALADQALDAMDWGRVHAPTPDDQERREGADDE